GAVRYVAVGGFATARSPAHQYPVGSAVAGSAKTAGIDEGLGEVDRMAVHPLPVCGQRARYAAQYVRSQMRHFDPRQNQEARVVGIEAEVGRARFGAPSYIKLAAAQMTRGRSPCHGRAGMP